MRDTQSEITFRPPTWDEIHRHVRRGEREQVLWIAEGVQNLGRRVRATVQAAGPRLTALARRSRLGSASSR